MAPPPEATTIGWSGHHTPLSHGRRHEILRAARTRAEGIQPDARSGHRPARRGGGHRRSYPGKRRRRSDGPLRRRRQLAPDVAGLGETKRLGPVVDDVVGARPIVSSFFLGKTDGGRRRDEQADDRCAHLAGSLLHEFVRREGSHVSARVTAAYDARPNLSSSLQEGEPWPIVRSVPHSLASSPLPFFSSVHLPARKAPSPEW